MVDYVMIL